MAKLDFNAADEVPSLDDQMKGIFDAEIGNSGMFDAEIPVQEEPPALQVPEEEQSQEPAQNPVPDTYDNDYQAYLAACKSRRDTIATAKKIVADAKLGKKKSVADWDVYISKVSLELVMAESIPAPVPPVKKK